MYKILNIVTTTISVILFLFITSNIGRNKIYAIHLESLSIVKFEQDINDDLSDNIATINMEIEAPNIEFNNLDISILASDQTQLGFNTANNTEFVSRQYLKSSDFIANKLSLTFDVPLLFDNENYFSCFIMDPYALSSYNCSDHGIEYKLVKITPQIPVYRFFNTKTGAHLYTASETEKLDLINESKSLPYVDQIWRYEYYKFAVFKNAIDSEGAIPVYRFFNTKEGGHIYTVSEEEKSAIINNLSKYTFEGIKYYVMPVAAEGFIPVYRFFNTKTGTHLYTISESEKTTIINTLPQYKFEGEKFYVLGN